MTDPIADMLTRIRNALQVKKPEVLVPNSKVKVKLAEILQQEGYINSYSVAEKTMELKVVLKYRPDGQAAISNLKRISKPGRRVYCGYSELPQVLNNLGIAVVSTSQGMMTARTARQKKVGGEVVCQIY